VPVRQQATRGGAAKADAAPLPPSAPSEAYTGTGTVKAEYARAGQWKAQPGAAPSAAPAPAAKD